MRRRNSYRCNGYDYSQNGLYFVTICTKNKECFFGNITNGTMQRSIAGNIAYKQMMWLEKQYDYVKIDSCVVMPNHVHMIIEIFDGAVGAVREPPLQCNQSYILPTRKIKPLSQLVGAYKTTSSKLIHRSDTPMFQWQRSFYDHIIRNNKSLNTIREYIAINPRQWSEDENAPCS